MRNKLYAIILSITIALTASLPVAAAQLTDIEGIWAQKEIQYFVDKGIISGYGDGTFSPEKSVTRAEFVRIVNGVYKYNSPANITFKDVNPADWFYNDIRYAVAAGFISGYSDNTFRPQNNITREEVASIIQRILKAPANTSYAPSKFDDVLVTSHYNGAIGALTSMGVMKGTSDNMFSPGSFETRADTAYSLYNALFSGTPTTNTVVDGNVIVVERSYGPSSDFSKESIPGKLFVKSSNSETTIKNVSIQGDLIIEADARNVYLENVTIQGKLIVNGGDSIFLERTEVQNMDVNNATGNVKIDASEDSVCYNSNIFSSCTLTEDTNALSKGFSNVVINGNSTSKVNVSLSGLFVAVDVYAQQTAVTLSRGQITDLYFNNTAESSTADLKSGTQADSVEIKAEKVKISGTGVINTAKIEAANVTLNTVPQTLTGSYAPKYTSNVENNNLVITVVNRSNAPVSSARVTLSGVSSSKTTDSDGKVTFTNVAMGKYDYTVEKSGFTSVSGTVDVSDYSTTRKITLSSSNSYSLSFTVSDNSTGATVGSATVDLKNVSSSSTSSSGYATFSGLDNGDYTYTVSKSGYTSATGSVTINGSNVSRTVKLVPTAATHDIEVYVRDSANKAISGATVKLGTKTGKTSSNGYVQLAGIANGTYTLTVEHANYNTFTETGFKVTGSATQYINLVEINPTYTVTINVKDDAGKNINGADVELGANFKDSTSSGSITFTGVEPGNYSLKVTHQDYNASTRTITVSNANHTLDILMEAKTQSN